MNRESVSSTIKLGLSSSPEFDPGTQVLPDKLLNQLFAIHRDGVKPFARMTETLPLDKLKSSLSNDCIILHPSIWRSIKAVRAKHRAKRRARARMRSRGYVAHGRHK